MGYRLRRIARVEPQKVMPETAVIFAQANLIKKEVDQDEQALRISLDTKAAMKISEL